MAATKTPWTKTLTSTDLQITSEFGFVALSILCVSGTITVLGGGSPGGVAAEAVTLAAGQSITFGSNQGSTMLLNNITVDASGGGVAALVGE